jgi:hypothetical protein
LTDRQTIREEIRQTDAEKDMQTDRKTAERQTDELEIIAVRWKRQTSDIQREIQADRYTKTYKQIDRRTSILYRIQIK